MNWRLIICLLVQVLWMSCTSVSDNKTEKVDKSLTLWYEQPASQWIESLLIGNGRIGAAIYGGVQQDTVGLNLSTLWSGAPAKESVQPEAASHLQEIRNLYFKGRFKEFKDLCAKYLRGNKEQYGTHLPMGNLIFGHVMESGTEVKDYVRSLDLNTAVSKVVYSIGNVNYTRESFVSNPDNLILIRLAADKKGQLNFTMTYDGINLPVATSRKDATTWWIEGDAYEDIHSDGHSGVHFCSGIRVLTCDGKVEIQDKSVSVRKASEVILAVSANSNYKNNNPETSCVQQLDKVQSKTYAEMLNNHIADYQNLFKRVDLRLGETDLSNTPTDKRFKALRSPQDDPQLYAMFYQYGRYLLIASSREDSPLPTNLQGIWNDNFACRMPWTCDFHLDINTEQNYWIAEPGNISECHQPLFNFIANTVPYGRQTARDLYGYDGWVAHVVTNAWGFTAPGWGLGWGLHVTGGIWLASHLWNHYEYTGDRRFLKETAYPVLKEAAVFFKNYLVKHPNRPWLVSGPSVSPENRYLVPGGERYSETMGATCDAVLIRDLFNSCIQASSILAVDKEFAESLKQTREKLQPLMIGKHGQLQEWLEDYEDAVPNHRHTSHLIALYPSAQITRNTTELARAAEITIDRRLSQPDWEDVEWTRGNLINFYARLGKGEKALQHAYGLIADNSSTALLTYSRGGIAGAKQDIFAMDGNTSGSCGISEMLVQSYDNCIYLLPALPASWNTGSFKGVRTRNGFEVSLEWKDGQLLKVEVLSLSGKPCRIEMNGKTADFKTQQGKTYQLDKDLNLL